MPFCGVRTELSYHLISTCIRKTVSSTQAWFSNPQRRRLMNKSWSVGSLPIVPETVPGAESHADGASENGTSEAENDDEDEEQSFATLQPGWKELCRILQPYRTRYAAPVLLHIRIHLRRIQLGSFELTSLLLLTVMPSRPTSTPRVFSAP